MEGVKREFSQYENQLIRLIRAAFVGKNRNERAALLDSTFRNWQEMNGHIEGNVGMEYAVKLDDGAWIQFHRTD